MCDFVEKIGIHTKQARAGTKSESRVNKIKQKR